MTASKRMPVVFVGHGSPMNAVEDNRWSQGFAALGRELPRPRAVLAVSAHWYVEGSHVTANARPDTIHDFFGFPPELYNVSYPAPGSPELALRIEEITGATPTESWGLDHGSWSVLRWMWPDADVPVVQLSMDALLDERGHLETGRTLATLRDEGLLIFASGNIVHNLRDAFTRQRSGDTKTPDWAQRFDADVAQALEEHDLQRLLELYASDDGRQSHPTPEHWLPLLYAAGASEAGDAVGFRNTGFDWGSLSMRCVTWGAHA